MRHRYNLFYVVNDNGFLPVMRLAITSDHCVHLRVSFVRGELRSIALPLKRGLENVSVRRLTW